MAGFMIAGRVDRDNKEPSVLICFQRWAHNKHPPGGLQGRTAPNSASTRKHTYLRIKM